MKSLKLFGLIALIPLLGSCSNIVEVDRTFVDPTRDILPCQDLIYNEFEDGYEVSLKKGVNITKVIVPETYNDKKVIRVADEAFIGEERLIILHLPNTITSIGDRAFAGLINLNIVNIPKGVKSIGEDAFENITFSTISFGDAKENIPEVKLENNNCVTYSTIDYVWNNDFVFSIQEDEAILSNIQTQKESYEVPTFVQYRNENYKVKTIGNRTFNKACKVIKHVTLPYSIEKISSLAFYSCIYLEEIYISEKVNIIEQYAFGQCSILKIYCEAESQPETWDEKWNQDNCEVLWGVKR